MILCVGTTPALQRSMKFASLTVDEVNRAVEVVETAAGKGINVARVLHLLGHDLLATGFVGGESGGFIRREMDREGIPHRFINVPFPTRTCITVIDERHKTTTELVEESQVVAEQYWGELEALVAEEIARCAALVLSGALPPQAPQDFYANCCKMANVANVPVIMDTRGQPLALAMPQRPLMVKPNRDELASTFGLDVSGDAQLKISVRRLIAMGAQSALITMGAAGAVFCDGGDFQLIAAPMVKAVNAIGSGDSVAAGFAAGVVQKLPLLQCAILGIACGSANAMTATPGMVHPADVERLAGEIRVSAF